MSNLFRLLLRRATAASARELALVAALLAAAACADHDAARPGAGGAPPSSQLAGAGGESITEDTPSGSEPALRAACQSDAPPQLDEPIAERVRLEPFEFTDHLGARHSICEFAGKPTVIEMVHSRCDSCRQVLNLFSGKIDEALGRWETSEDYAAEGFISLSHMREFATYTRAFKDSVVSGRLQWIVLSVSPPTMAGAAAWPEEFPNAPETITYGFAGYDVLLYLAFAGATPFEIFIDADLRVKGVGRNSKKDLPHSWLGIQPG